jgi:hypothetical protein
MEIGEVVENLLSSLAQSNTELMYAIDDFLEDKSPIKDILSNYIYSISDSMLKKYLEDDKYWHLRKGYSELEQKKQISAYILSDEIDKYRFNYLMELNGIPFPYDKISNDIEYDEHYLIPYSEKIHSGALHVDGMSYSLMPSIQGKNSMYWTYEFLPFLCKYGRVSVRLDPFMKIATKDYSSMMYKAYMYGRELDWERINSLRGFEEVKWISCDRLFASDFTTGAFWERRKDGIHFICEEIPKEDIIDRRGSRYFHSIYDPEQEVFTHIDGAIRLFTQDEYLNRMNMHVRKCGKVGKRIKLFKIDGAVPRALWVDLIVKFFFWNTDISNYFAKT